MIAPSSKPGHPTIFENNDRFLNESDIIVSRFLFSRVAFKNPASIYQKFLAEFTMNVIGKPRIPPIIKPGRPKPKRANCFSFAVLSPKIRSSSPLKPQKPSRSFSGSNDAFESVTKAGSEDAFKSVTKASFSKGEEKAS